MMKNLFKLFAFLSIFSIVACGPSEEEIKQREQFIADSTSNYIENEKIKADSILKYQEEQKLLEEELRIHKEKIEVGKDIKKMKISQAIEKGKEQLAREKEKLAQINEFKFGRTPSEKQNQINQQNKRIDDLKSAIKILENAIPYTNLYEVFDFQDTPEGTVKHLFEAAKNNDFSKLKFLIDPYGEFNDSAIELCFFEFSPIERQENYKKLLLNGRVMNTLENNDEIAIIEVAIGQNSDELEKVTLVNRLGKWFIQKI